MKIESEREALHRVCSLSMVFIHQSVLGPPIDSGYVAGFYSTIR